VGSTFRLVLKNFDFELSRCARACGDGVVDRTEECDDGRNDGGYAACGPQCRWDQWCGDGVTQAPAEQCDDGKNDVPYGDAGCTPACRLPPRCGDGQLDGRFGEECDDGNPATGDGCTACRLER
jgi:cysteine-rich repeat protein